MRIGIFGGSFNPPHVGHLRIAEEAREQAELDRICWIPAPSPPHKETRGLASFDHRLTMTRLATEGHAHFEVSDIEQQLPRPSYTLHTLKYFHRHQPDERFFLIIGGDSLASFHDWHKPRHILALADLIVYNRPDAEYSNVDSTTMAHVHFLKDTLMLPISSTDIRLRIRANKSIRYLIPEQVRTYIQQNQLYEAGPDEPSGISS